MELTDEQVAVARALQAIEWFVEDHGGSMGGEQRDKLYKLVGAFGVASIVAADAARGQS